MGTGVSYAGGKAMVKLTGSEADHSLASSAETSSWRDAQLSKSATLPLPLTDI